MSKLKIINKMYLKLARYFLSKLYTPTIEDGLDKAVAIDLIETLMKEIDR